MKELFIKKRFGAQNMDIIHQANIIISEYHGQGYDLTLRQLYYQFVARDLIANKQSEYKRLGAIISDARLAGLIDWNAIVDRTRNLRSSPSWDSGADIIEGCANQFHLDPWENQDSYTEVWIEKDALVGVISSACSEWSVPYFACRGYASQSELYSAGKRLQRHIDNGKKVTILHLGDFDPSGIDMTRDNQRRLSMFSNENIDVKRLALNDDQIKKYNPPPNPAKLTDSRAKDYVKKYGYSSWELDALEPQVINDLIRSEVRLLIDKDAWDETNDKEYDIRQKLSELAETIDF